MIALGKRFRVFAGIILALAAISLGCATMEKKRDKFFAEGKKLFEKGDYVQARLQFKNAIQIDPKFAEGYLWLGKTEFKTQNFRGAYGALTQAVELNQNFTEAHVILGHILLGARRLEDADAKAKLALQQDPQNIDAKLLAASTAMGQKKPGEALALLEEVRRQDPNKVAAYLLKSSIEVSQKEYEAAIATLEAGLQANPKDIGLHVAKTRLATAQKKYEEGEATLRQAIALEPKNVKLFQDLVVLYSISAQPDKVEQTLRQIIEMEPAKESHVIALAQFLAGRGRYKDGEQVLKNFSAQNASNYAVRFALADYYLSRGREARGEKVLRETIDLDPKGPSGLRAKNALARLMVSRNRLDEAEKVLEDVLKDNPRDMEATLTQGLIALSKKDGLRAVTNFRILVNDHPQKAENWLLMARAHLLNKEPDQAKEKTRKALEIKPDFLEARKFHYDLFVQNKDYEGAIQTIRGYLRFNDKDLFNLTALGEVYLLKEDYGQVKATFQKIVDVDPKNPQGYFNLGMLARRQKQIPQAIKYFEEALAQQPNFMPALQQLVDIYREQKKPEKALEAVKQDLASVSQFQVQGVDIHRGSQTGA
ncbi:MAG: tetratricopeptide repeat protein [Deltaproteobacteria bacterium]|nr:tetratricopeptide repeat protein [Deltaproteobacteria bacterium]